MPTEITAAPRPALRVLIAEDDALNRTVISRMVTRFGHQVTSAVDGQDAVEKFSAACFDLVLMDSNMPQLSGAEALLRMRAWEAQHGRTPTPAIALTGESAEQHRDALLEAGFAAFLAKPFGIDELKAIIERHFPPQSDLPGTD